MLTRFLVPVLVAALPAAAAAQSVHPLVGSWAIEYPGGARNMGGQITPVMMKGKLTVEAIGDSLVATLVTEPPADAPAPTVARPPIRLAAKAAGTPAVFVQQTRARLRMGGEDVERDMTVTWTFTPSGDDLSGSMERAMEGVQMSAGAQALKGTRNKTG